MVAWLLTIARNVAVNMLPTHRAYPVDPKALLGLQETRPSPDADGQLAPVSQPMREALMRLPGEQRRALVLAVFYGYTAREVSELDKTPVGTVKTPLRDRAWLSVAAERGVGACNKALRMFYVGWLRRVWVEGHSGRVGGRCRRCTLGAASHRHESPDPE